ncbi:MAG: leucyl/phenylalanyl-tRNA--protein transferase [Candidatus Eutrophobiaceae bacterium]
MSTRSAIAPLFGALEKRFYCDFPASEKTLNNGLLAIGGDLSLQRLRQAYAHGIFPWFNDDLSEILWWCPEPRCVLKTAQMHISRSLRKRIARGGYQTSFNQAFRQVMQHCAHVRRADNGTWITSNMLEAYTALHDQGDAHSVEIWMDGELAGGLYGVALGKMFFGESMFSLRTDASKLALLHLCELMHAQDCPLIDCQIPNPHLCSLGAEPMPRLEFLRQIYNLSKARTCLVFPQGE